MGGITTGSTDESRIISPKHEEILNLSEMKNCCGLDRGIMNALALFMYFKKYKATDDEVTVFNEWSRSCGFDSIELDIVAHILEHIRKLKLVKRDMLKKALLMDNFLNEREEGTWQC